jgi:hypothetical protein
MIRRLISVSSKVRVRQRRAKGLTHSQRDAFNGPVIEDTYRPDVVMCSKRGSSTHSSSMTVAEPEKMPDPTPKLRPQPGIEPIPVIV